MSYQGGKKPLLYHLGNWNLEIGNTLTESRALEFFILSLYCPVCLVCLYLYSELPNVLGKHDIIGSGKENQMF